MAKYKFTLKTDPPSAFKPDLKEPVPEKIKVEPLAKSKEWNTGVVYAEAQNFARTVCCFFDIGCFRLTVVRSVDGVACKHDDPYGNPVVEPFQLIFN